MNQILAIAWFRAEQWERLLSVSSDRKTLEGTYEEWRVNAEGQIAALQAQGFKVTRVDVDLEELINWCGIKRMPINGESRSEFAAHKSRLESKRH
jgi:hypothetical protein